MPWEHEALVQLQAERPFYSRSIDEKTISKRQHEFCFDALLRSHLRFCCDVPMSVSLKLKQAIDVARAMGHDRAIMPPNRSFQPKHQNMQCRRCAGAGVDKEKGGACCQCLGKGFEKLSLKVIIRTMKKTRGGGEKMSGLSNKWWDGVMAAIVLLILLIGLSMVFGWGCAAQRGIININIGVMAKAPANIPLERPYVVRSGDCLWSIAAKSNVYADPFLWPALWKANRDAIQNPDLIYEGQALEINRQMNVDIVHVMASQWPKYSRHK